MYYVHLKMTIVKADNYRIMTGEHLFKTYDEAYAYIESWEKQLSDDDDSEEHY